MIASTYLLALGVIQHKKKYSDYKPDPNILAKIEEFHRSADVYGNSFPLIISYFWFSLTW